MGYNPADESNKNTHNNWVQFGQFVRFKPLYESAYLEPILTADIIYICEFCLTPMENCDKFKSHVVSVNTFIMFEL